MGPGEGGFKAVHCAPALSHLSTVAASADRRSLPSWRGPYWSLLQVELARRRLAFTLRRGGALLPQLTSTRVPAASPQRLPTARNGNATPASLRGERAEAAEVKATPVRSGCPTSAAWISLTGAGAGRRRDRTGAGLVTGTATSARHGAWAGWTRWSHDRCAGARLRLPRSASRPGDGASAPRSPLARLRRWRPAGVKIPRPGRSVPRANRAPIGTAREPRKMRRYGSPRRHAARWLPG